MALDHLGTIAAKMRTASLQEAGDDRIPMMPMSLEEVFSQILRWDESLVTPHSGFCELQT